MLYCDSHFRYNNTGQSCYKWSHIHLGELLQSFTIVSLVHMFLNNKTKAATKPLSILPGARTLLTHLHHCPQNTPNTTVKLNSTNTQTKHQTNTKACVFVYKPLQRKGDVQKYCMYFYCHVHCIMRDMYCHANTTSKSNIS